MSLLAELTATAKNGSIVAIAAVVSIVGWAVYFIRNRRRK